MLVLGLSILCSSILCLFYPLGHDFSSISANFALISTFLVKMFGLGSASVTPAFSSGDNTGNYCVSQVFFLHSVLKITVVVLVELRLCSTKLQKVCEVSLTIVNLDSFVNALQLASFLFNEIVLTAPQLRCYLQSCIFLVGKKKKVN